MTAAIYNMVIDQGSDFAVRFTLKQGGAPIPLTGYSARGQIRLPKQPTAAVVAVFTCTITDAANGVILIALSNQTSKNMNAGKYVYDIEIYTNNDEYVKRLVQGDINLKGEITR